MSQEAPLFYALPKVYYSKCQFQFYGMPDKIRSFELFMNVDKAEI